MKKITRQKTISETAFITNDGTQFEYPILAEEHEIMMQAKKISHLKRKMINIPYSEIKGVFYHPKSLEDANNLKEYFKLKKCFFDKEIDDLCCMGMVSFGKKRKAMSFNDFVDKLNKMILDIEKEVKDED